MLIPDPDALSIVQKLNERGYTSYYAGGCVRDALLGRPYKDIDIATDAEPSEVISLFRRTVAVGAHFGVVKVLIGDTEYDVATFRKDGDYSDGRHPESVNFSTPEEDAQRRDITINGMFYDPLKDEIIDFVGGKDDLERKVIRAIGDPEARINEDKLRILRVLRFSGTLGFTIENKTYESVQKHRSEISLVSIERITEELSRMLSSDRPADCVRLLIESGLMGEILPEVMAMDGVRQPEQFHPEGDVLEHTLLMFDLFQSRMTEKEVSGVRCLVSGEGSGDISPPSLPSPLKEEGEEKPDWQRGTGNTERSFRPSLAVGLAILFHDIGKPPTYVEAEDRIRFSGHCVKGGRMTAGIMRKLRFPNTFIEHVSDLVSQHMKFMAVRDMRVSTLKRFIRQDSFDEHLDLHWLDCMASHKDLDSYTFCMEKLDEFSREEIKLKPPRIISGNDLIREGYSPGPLFGEILEFIEDLQLEEGLNDRDEILTEVKLKFPAE